MNIYDHGGFVDLIRKEDHPVCCDGNVVDYLNKPHVYLYEYNSTPVPVNEPHFNFLLNQCLPKMIRVRLKETRLRMTQTFNIGK